jgi:transcriptional regulator with XRE-family HTH domain
MTPVELVRAREALGLSRAQLAIELELSEETIEHWESGAGNVPRVYARQIAWLAAISERQQALAASGLPTCEWVTRWEAEPEPEKQEARLARFEALEQHGASCATCEARERYVTERFPPMPEPPLSPGLRVLRAIALGVARLPAWARPAAVGAMIGVALVALRVGIQLLIRGPSWPLFRAMGEVAGAVALAGAAGGLGYQLVREPSRRLGPLGAYVTGIAAALSTLCTFAAITLVMGDEPLVHGPDGWLILLGVGAVIGLVIGHSWFRDKAAE